MQLKQLKQQEACWKTYMFNNLNSVINKKSEIGNVGLIQIDWTILERGKCK